MQLFKKILTNTPLFLFICLTQGIQIAGVVIIALINDAPIQCAIIYLGMILCRNIFGDSFHAKSFWTCTAVTWSTFYILTAAAPALFICISGSAFLGIGVSFLMHHLHNYLTLLENKKINNFVLQKHCDKEELHQECRIRKLTEYDYMLLCARYVDCLSGTQLEIKFTQSQQNIRKLIKEAETKFNDITE